MEMRYPFPREELAFRIPVEFLQEFKQDARIVIRHPWIIGIPAPEALLEKLGALQQLKDFEVILVPKEIMR